MPQFSDVVTHKDELWRKALGVVIAVAPYSTAALTTILDAADGTLAALPTGWTQLGRPTEDGITWPRETELSEIFGLGSTNPGRSDIRRATKRITFTIMESRRKVIELVQGVDLSTVATKKVPATTGTSSEVTWDEPELPNYDYMRLIAIARDTTAGGEMYIGRQLLRAKVTEIGEETWNDQDNTMATELTLTAYFDSTAGTAMRHFRGGPGYTEIVQNEGFAAPA